MDLIRALGHALDLTFSMTWEVTWALILGFALSGAVQAVVSKGQMTRLLPDDSPGSLGIATGLGAASSSCSYAAVALARALFRKGANFTAAMAFEVASTNLVIELGIILAVLIGWQSPPLSSSAAGSRSCSWRSCSGPSSGPRPSRKRVSRRTGAWSDGWKATPR
jgi:uncharacterized membrane protein YraQ (UPF0718 family)